MLAYVRMTLASGALTWTLIARIPWTSTSSRVISTGSMARPRSVSVSSSKSAPASISAPRVMSPAIPAMQSK